MKLDLLSLNHPFRRLGLRIGLKQDPAELIIWPGQGNGPPTIEEPARHLCYAQDVDQSAETAEEFIGRMLYKAVDTRERQKFSAQGYMATPKQLAWAMNVVGPLKVNGRPLEDSMSPKMFAALCQTIIDVSQQREIPGSYENAKHFLTEIAAGQATRSIMDLAEERGSMVPVVRNLPTDDRERREEDHRVNMRRLALVAIVLGFLFLVAGQGGFGPLFQ